MDEALSISYINTILSIFKNILKFAKQYGYLTTSIPIFQLPKQRKTPSDIFSLSEWACLNNYLLTQNDNFSFGIFLCMYTGIRIGELCGLRWEDFDSKSGQLMIKRTVYRIKNMAYTSDNSLPKTIVSIASPKTPSSIREMPLPAFLCRKMQQYSSDPLHYILTVTTKCMEPRIVQKKYKNILKKCEIRYLNFHSLRHSFASIGISKGFNCKTLSEILGHSSVNITLNTYVHSSIEQRRQCMELLVMK
ncbi:site-specific integrase [Parablautia muri]|uniref:Site-specific integrase n=1 Tax=Parablautia muri TaxID=2320879 RepID=A0A9X5BD00_9FIRM|nr:site-specific integrase [Parablautia muri]NBJ91367.1 site-specific integrase [Parablautia muri]